MALPISTALTSRTESWPTNAENISFPKLRQLLQHPVKTPTVASSDRNGPGCLSPTQIARSFHLAPNQTIASVPFASCGIRPTHTALDRTFHNLHKMFPKQTHKQLNVFGQRSAPWLITSLRQKVLLCCYFFSLTSRRVQRVLSRKGPKMCRTTLMRVRLITSPSDFGGRK